MKLMLEEQFTGADLDKVKHIERVMKGLLRKART